MNKKKLIYFYFLFYWKNLTASIKILIQCHNNISILFNLIYKKKMQIWILVLDQKLVLKIKQMELLIAINNTIYFGTNFGIFIRNLCIWKNLEKFLCEIWDVKWENAFPKFTPVIHPISKALTYSIAFPTCQAIYLYSNMTSKLHV